MYKANGKLLLTSEYFVLDGALALAVPVRFGQSLEVKGYAVANTLLWESYTAHNDCWFRAAFSMPELECSLSTDEKTAATLQHILTHLREERPTLFNRKKGLRITTRLDFPRQWGLGTSSTLIWLLAKWAGVDAYELLSETLGGSGYDIACADARGPILYQLDWEGKPMVQAADFNPPFLSQLYFIYLGKKQSSRSGIEHYRQVVAEKRSIANRLSEITRALLRASTLSDFEELIREHEQLISTHLKMPLVKDAYFSDFPGTVKSLGAWGGDFVLATSEWPEEKVRRYFSERGFGVFFRYVNLIKEKGSSD